MLNHKPKTMNKSSFIIICLLALCFLLQASSTGGQQYLSLPTDQPYRTGYHFQPPQNWMNDPNGPMRYKGVYHFFYQYNPNGPLFGDIMIWGHSVSYDLVNWIHIDPAIYPTQPADINSCFSGSATILPGNKPVMLYTGLDTERRQVQNLAVPKNLSDPFLREWVKHSANPIMTTPEGVKLDDFRDPSTAWLGYDGKWRVLVGSKKNNLGVAYIYQSKDFLKWEKSDYPILSMEGTSTWECPDFFPVPVNSTNGLDTSIVHNPSVKHVMKVGFNGQDWYTIGLYKPGENYVPENELRGNSLDMKYDYGKFYASKSFFDNTKNRRVLWGWVSESDSAEDDVARGWSGLQAIPRSVWLDQKGKQLMQWPVEEIEELHGKEVSIRHKKLHGGSLHEVEGISASQADVKISFKLPNLKEAETMDPSWTDPQLLCSQKDASSSGKFGPFGLLALASKDLTEQTAIFFRVFRGNGKYVVLMCSDQSRSSVGNNIDKTSFGAFVDIDPRHEEISLRSLIDHSIIESFGGEGKTCITARVYPRLAINKEARLLAFNNGTQSVVISKLNAWSMKKARLNPEETSRSTA